MTRHLTVTESGLYIPTGLREFDRQIVFRTPRATIQHFGSQSLDARYGMIDASHFGDKEEIGDPKNPELAPHRVTIKPERRDTQTFVVEITDEVVADGGKPPEHRRADALEAIADQLAIQNAVLFELVRQQERRAEIAMERPPDETRTPESTATAVQDAALHLAERVDLDEVRRWADE
jgi:hypothetical protein